MRWDPETVPITGASSGFGREVAKILAGRRARVVVVARRAEALRSLVQELGGSPGKLRRGSETPGPRRAPGRSGGTGDCPGGWPLPLAFGR
ncbi:MAG: SDR family NAD(P)-dependent oxidoreductase [Actinomycetota bacterium]